jgi:DNA-binding response OmpR family regulator
MSETRKILLLEDDANLGLILQEHLHLQGFAVTLCENGEDGLAAYRRGGYDLCLVDIMMPKKDGFTFARELRADDQQTPLIFLTAKSLKEDKIEGFKIGCDDYLTKPFSIEELLLRIEAVLKRSGGICAEESSPRSFAIGTYTFDHPRQVLRYADREHKLTAREADLLFHLCLHMNRTLARDSALRKIWGDESYFSGRSMDVFISKLRKYLKDDPNVEIVNVHSKGFKLMVH